MAGFQLIRRMFGSEHGERRAEPRSGVPRDARILVVDDSPTIRAVLGKMLNQDGQVVLKAGDGPAAIEMARQELPDLIFLDIVMPGMNGFAVLRALRRDPLTQDIPIVMISGNLQATEQFYVQRFGADDFMKKPFGRGEVFARIQQLTASGRLSVRSRATEDALPAEIELSESEHAAIPDIAMPDPDDMIRQPAEPSS
ncbi:MAG: response regulator [Rhodanobacter sp.]|jgi:twitching motility two-component system response regulator PilH